jgi:hypothetical protein
MSAAEPPVPRLPRSRGLKLSGPQLVRIALTATLLVLIIVVQRPCADSVSKFVIQVDDGSGWAPMPRPGAVDEPRGIGSAGDYEILRSDMTPEELKAAIERSHARAAARERAAAARAAPGSAAPGSAAPGALAPP